MHNTLAAAHALHLYDIIHSIWYAKKYEARNRSVAPTAMKPTLALVR